MNAPSLDRLRLDVAAKIRGLRRDRRWTQAELGRRLGLSQARLSQIERGDGSFTAEQLLTALALFNVSMDHFVRAADRNAVLHNSLARLGATHLAEISETPPSAGLERPEDVIVEALVSIASPRQITALAAVLARQTDIGVLRRVDARLTELGLERRFRWVVDNTNEAIRADLNTELPREWAQRYRRVNITLAEFLAVARAHRTEAPRDILDQDIRTTKSVDATAKESSSISRAWGIVTSIQVEDFRTALGAARGTDR